MLRNPRRCRSSVSEDCFSESILLAARKMGLPVRWSRRASSRSGRGEFGARVYDHNDDGGFVESEPGLAENF